MFFILLTNKNLWLRIKNFFLVKTRKNQYDSIKSEDTGLIS